MRTGVLLAVLGAVLTLSACSATVVGTATVATVDTADSSSSGSDASGPGEPCELLSDEELIELGYEPGGDFAPADPGRLAPPTCTFGVADYSSGLTGLLVAYAVDLRFTDYLDGATTPEWEKEVGGLTWGRYPAGFGDDATCLLATTMSETTFVVVMSSDFGDAATSCDEAEDAVPYVTARLPGGEPAQVEPAQPSPLAEVDACSLLTSKEAEKLGYRGRGTADESGSDGEGCNWVFADGDRKKMLIVTVRADRGAPEPENKPTTVDADGRAWRVYPTDIEGLCIGDLEITDSSSVQIAVTGVPSGKNPACDVVEQAAPLVTAKLPD